MPETDASEEVPETIPEPIDPASSLLTPQNPAVQEPQLVTTEAVVTDPRAAAIEVLSDFLAMENMQDRLPLLESKLDSASLNDSVLNTSLPAVAKVTIDIRKNHPSQEIVDYYYNVNFLRDDDEIDPHTILVRTRGNEAPKVVVDPFLDTFGGRFERFARKTSQEPTEFQVIISAGAFCYDDIPSANSKFTLKILARDDGKELGRAYFAKDSSIGELLESASSGIAYGQAIPARIRIAWNLSENPEKPYLEALEIISLSWNP